MHMNENAGLQMLACSYISGQLDKLMKHLQGARTCEDVEDVHQVRVASRRMRAAMRIFTDCFDKKAVANWQKRIKNLLKAFGKARDLDVQIIYLAEQLEQLPAEQKKARPGIRRMLLRWRQQRGAVQPNVVKAIESIEKKQVLTQIHLEMEKNLFLLKPQKPSVQSPEVYHRAYEQIRGHLGDLMGRRMAIENPDDAEGHHKMRIAAKKLRYVMEICNEAMDDQLKPAIKTVKKVQTLLGDIHDCDVWDCQIDAFIETERQRALDFYGSARPFSRILPGLEYLKAQRRDTRRQLYQQALEFIEQLEQDAFWQKLLDFLQITCLQEGTIDDNLQEQQTDQTDQAAKAPNDSNSV